MLGRWLDRAKILILNGPTVGVDVGSKAKIHKIIRDLAQQESGSSDDFRRCAGLVSNCNRVHVMHDGRFVAQFERPSLSEENQRQPEGAEIGQPDERLESTEVVIAFVLVLVMVVIGLINRPLGRGNLFSLAKSMSSSASWRWACC